MPKRLRPMTALRTGVMSAVMGVFSVDLSAFNAAVNAVCAAFARAVNSVMSKRASNEPCKPTSISGTATLTPNGTGSTLTYDLEVKASVPLVGGKLEKLVVELTTEGFDKEQVVGAAWLAGERR